jgi:hypothetical protein
MRCDASSPAAPGTACTDALAMVIRGKVDHPEEVGELPPGRSCGLLAA